MSVKGLPFSVNRGSDETENQHIKNYLYANVLPISPNEHALSTMNSNYFYIQQNATLGVGCTTTNIELTAHAAKRGDFLRFDDLTFAEFEVPIIEIVDANNFTIGGVLQVAPVGGEFVDIMRPVKTLANDDGSLAVNVSTGAIAFNQDGFVVEVSEDTVTPANNLPLPVKLTGITGDINITANDLNVQLNHDTANPDSVQIGDGTNLMAVNASLEAQVRDDDANTSLVMISGQLPAVLGADVAANSLTVVLATDQPALPLSADASTETKQDNIITELQGIAALDFATETTLAAMSAKLPATLGQKARAASLAVTLSTEDQSTQDAIAASLALLDDTVGGSELQVDIVDAGPLLTEVTFQSEIDDTQAILQSLDDRLGGSLTPYEFDEVTITYRTTGNGIGEIDTVVFELATVTVATLTLTYDADDNLSNVLRT